MNEPQGRDTTKGMSETNLLERVAARFRERAPTGLERMLYGDPPVDPGIAGITHHLGRGSGKREQAAQDLAIRTAQIRGEGADGDAILESAREVARERSRTTPRHWYSADVLGEERRAESASPAPSGAERGLSGVWTRHRGR